MDAVAKTLHFVSLGCAKNRVDTEVMVGVGEASGYELVANPGDAEVIVVNTCGFIDPAKEESIETIFEMAQHKDSGRCRKLIVAGCLSQRYAEQLEREMPEVDHFLGSSDMLRLKQALEPEGPRMLVGNPAQWTLRATDPRRLSQRSHSVFVKIAEGCNRSCSFCAIPGIRGKQRSRPLLDIRREVERLVAEGAKEINLVSQDTIAYGRDLDARPTLAELTRSLAQVPGLRWLRLHYLYPETMKDDLVSAIVEHDNVLPYVDMPLQHASDSMLRRMRRGHGGRRLYDVVDRLRESLPELVFRTTFIVGHPGETARDFDELLAFVRHAQFDHVGVFLYSHEEGTISGAMDDLVAPGLAVERQAKLADIQRGITKRKLQRFVGHEVEVLVDGESDESEFLLDGRWWGQAPEVDGRVILTNGTAQPGEMRTARVEQAGDYDLVASLEGLSDGRSASRVHLRTL